jgi:hypothetical protein
MSANASGEIATSEGVWSTDMAAVDEQLLRDPFVTTDREVTRDSLLPSTARQPRQGAHNLVPLPLIATLVTFDVDDRPLIRYGQLLPGERVVARSAVRLQRSHLGADVVVLCECGDPRRPIVMGVLQDSIAPESPALQSQAPVTFRVDDDRCEITAERHIALRCGEASITLTRAGKVIIKGAYVLSRSSGYNKIKGAAVDIN